MRMRLKTSRRNLGWILAPTLALLVAASGSAFAAAGQLDTTFGESSGTTVSPYGTSFIGTRAVAMTEMPDGGYAGLSSFASSTDYETIALVEKFDSDGLPDSGFGTGGQVMLNPYPAQPIVPLAIEAIGDRIFVLWMTYSGMVSGLTAIQANGALDSAFGSGGTVVFPTPAGRRFTARQIAVAPNGDIVAVGPTSSALDPYGTPTWPAAVRVRANGTFDLGFGTNGFVMLGSGETGVSSGARSIAESDSGPVILGSIGSDLAIWRLTWDGVLVPDHGINGVVRISLPAVLEATDVAVDELGRAIIGGRTVDNDGFVARFDATGEFDTTYGIGAGITFPYKWVFTITPGMNGDVYASIHTGSPEIFRIASIDDTGALDPTFGQSGMAYALNNARAFDLTVDTSGRVVAFGQLETSTASPRPYASVLLRLDGGDSTAPTIDLRHPADGAAFLRDASVAVEYACDDGAGSGISACEGTAASGTLLDTSMPGTYSFEVLATDNAGNSSTVTHTYVVYEAGVEFDYSHCPAATEMARWEFDDPADPWRDTSGNGRRLVPDGAQAISAGGGDPANRALRFDRGDGARFEPAVGDTFDMTCSTIDIWVRMHVPLDPVERRRYATSPDYSDTLLGTWGDRGHDPDRFFPAWDSQKMMVRLAQDEPDSAHRFVQSFGEDGAQRHHGPATGSQPRPNALADQWVHVTVVFGHRSIHARNGMGWYPIRTVYLDGVTAASRTIPWHNVVRMWSHNNPLTIGNAGDRDVSPATARRMFCACDIGRVSMWNGALTGAQVAGLHASHASRY